MIIVTAYLSKKELKNSIGKTLKYRETNFHSVEFKANGTFPVAHRPSLSYFEAGREFFAEVTMKDGLISKVT